MMTRPDAVDLALLACVGGDRDDRAVETRLRGFADADWPTLVRRATAQGVGALVYERIKSLDRDLAPAEIFESLRRRYIDNSMRNLRLRCAVRSLAVACDEVGVPVMLLKGAYVAIHIYENAALRHMGDIDLLVGDGHMEKALRAAQELGFRWQTPVPGDADLSFPSFKHAPRVADGDVVVEFHRTIFPRGFGGSADVRMLWERSIPATIAGVETRALCLEDLLLHTCGHAAYDHKFEFGLRPLCDIDRILRKRGDQVRWETFVERAGAWGWRRGVYLSLCLAKELMGSAVSDEVLAELAPRPLDAGIVSTAKQMVFNDRAQARSFHLNVARWHRATLWGRLRLLYDRMLWCPEHLEPTWGYYARRGGSLLFVHVPATLRLLAGSKPTRRLAESKLALAAWLDEGAGASRPGI